MACLFYPDEFHLYDKGISTHLPPGNDPLVIKIRTTFDIGWDGRRRNEHVLEVAIPCPHPQKNEDIVMSVDLTQGYQVIKVRCYPIIVLKMEDGRNIEMVFKDEKGVEAAANEIMQAQAIYKKWTGDR